MISSNQFSTTYKEYLHNESFKYNFRELITRMLSNLDYLR